MAKRKRAAYTGILAKPIAPDLAYIVAPNRESNYIRRETDKRIKALYTYYGLKEANSDLYELFLMLAKDYVPGFRVEFPRTSSHRKSGPEGIFRVGGKGVRLWALVQKYGNNLPKRAGKINVAAAIRAVIRKNSNEFGHYKEKSLRKDYENTIKYNPWLRWYKKYSKEQEWSDEQLFEEILRCVPQDKESANDS